MGWDQRRKARFTLHGNGLWIRHTTKDMPLFDERKTRLELSGRAIVSAKQVARRSIRHVSISNFGRQHSIQKRKLRQTTAEQRTRGPFPSLPFAAFSPKKNCSRALPLTLATAHNISSYLAQLAREEKEQKEKTWPKQKEGFFCLTISVSPVDFLWQKGLSVDALPGQGRDFCRRP